jgi:hypothetical protein
MSSQLDVIAIFETKSNHDSTLTIILSSPFSEQRKEDPELLEKAFFYTVTILFAGEKEYNMQAIPLFSFSDTILIKNLPPKPIEKIFIRIYPYQSIEIYSSYYPYLSVNYSLKGIHSNYLSLYVPKFSAYYIYYARFYKKEIEVMDNCTLIVDKRHGLSKCKGKKFNKKWQLFLFQIKNPYGTDEWGNKIEE